jgi:hypothetical protein
MKPLQVYVDDADLARLESWSRQRNMTKSQVIRAAIRALTHPGANDDPLLSLSGMVHDRLPADVSEQFDRYLEETFVAKAPASYAKADSPHKAAS